MPKYTDISLEQIQHISQTRHTFRRIFTTLSLLVILGVFWSLKLTGIGIAGEAFCGHAEHTHDESCLQKTLICPLAETPPHLHTEACLQKTLTCPLSEDETHTHEAACWTVDTGFGCGQAEADGHIHTAECVIAEATFACGIDLTHIHTEACYNEQQHRVCGINAGEGHTHGDDCYAGSGSCELEEHTHVESCYSDIYADLETSDDWEMTFADMTRGPTTRENVVLVAQSQLGYTESVLNYQVDADGVRRGITRYGQWYGNPYGDWSAMFASFCLDYAGGTGLPMNAGPEAMRLEWEEYELYLPAEELQPEIGNLLFLQKEEEPEVEASEEAEGVEASAPVEEAAADAAVPEVDEAAFEAANAVAIITGFDEENGIITVIEGDLENAVSETEYSLEDPAIMGYGIVPDMNLVMTLDEPAVTAAGDPCTVWLDGTDGGLRHLNGSPNTAMSTNIGTMLELPSEWTSPTKYSYKLRGWYDVTNARYYAAGAEMEVTGNAVLYADWVAASYDLGVFNAQVADTVSTNAFITTHMFDYNYLFNVQSSNPQVTVSNREHKETWSMLTTGNVKYQNAATIDFIFGEADGGGELSNPNNRSNRNRYQSATTISSGIYNAEMGEILYSPYNAFDPATGTGIIGKTYLGTADHLFQIIDDPSNERYGYYYYDSLRNGISYNQSNSRFYVYEYLSATSDAIGSSNADFLPLNSPYANTNGRTMRTYTYAGIDGEYNGVTHYRYDTNETDSGVFTEFAYGMRSDIRFFLPNDPGTGGNKDLNGNDIEFEFSGDDDLWVLIDGIVVLDIGGIHQRIAGDINFSTGAVNVNGRAATSLMDLGITSGDHTLTVLYLERGASMSNCSIYFNLVPRFGMEIKKEDVLTQEMLDGTQFTVYEDFECTQPAELWESEAAYNADTADGALDESQSTFTVANGVAKIWGFGSGSTYYIKETGPPGKEGYGLSQGVIRMTIEKGGLATYSVDVIADADGNEPSTGFTVHGVKIDETTQTVYIVVTNAPETVVETTTVQVVKKWEDAFSHDNDYIQAYLTVTQPDGTVRRIREITLSNENKWTHIWTNLPKYDYDTMAEVRYGVEESYESGYYSTVRQVTKIEIETTTWAEAAAFVHGENYILKTNRGYLSTTSTSDATLKWVDEATAQVSPLATWTATVSGNNNNKTVKLTNGAGQILTFNNGNNNNNRYFYARTGSYNYQEFRMEDAGTGFRLYYSPRTNTKYYIYNTNINSSGRISSTTSSGNALILTPMKKITQTDVQDVRDWAYQITNTPLESGNETSMTVKKEWVIPEGFDHTLYQEYAVSVRLLADGVNTGRSITLNLKNNWQGSFLGLPYANSAGQRINYTVVEVWGQENWSVEYGGIEVSEHAPPVYSTTITNTYHPGGPMLPSTGTAARMMYELSGACIILATLGYGIVSRRKRERRMK